MTETAILIMSSVSTGRCNHLRHGTILSVWRNFWSALFTVTAVLFGGASAATSGTTIKFNPPLRKDTISKHGVTTVIKTRHLCITAMKVYEEKSLEVRYEALCVDRQAFFFLLLLFSWLSCSSVTFANNSIGLASLKLEWQQRYKIHLTMTICFWSSPYTPTHLSLIHIWRCRRLNACRSRWSPYH